MWYGITCCCTISAVLARCLLSCAPLQPPPPLSLSSLLVIHSSSPLSHIFREYFSFSAISMVYYHREERSYKQLAVPSLQSICHRSSRFTLHLFTPVWEMEMKRDGGSSVCVNRWNSGHLCALGLCVSHGCVFWMCAGFEEDKQDYIYWGMYCSSSSSSSSDLVIGCRWGWDQHRCGTERSICFNYTPFKRICCVFLLSFYPFFSAPLQSPLIYLSTPSLYLFSIPYLPPSPRALSDRYEVNVIYENKTAGSPWAQHNLA